MTESDGEPHKVDYTKVGFETRNCFPRVWASHVDRLEDIVCHYVNSGIAVVDIAAPSTSEPNSAQKAPNGTAPDRKFTAS